jgi:hypothetical protein
VDHALARGLVQLARRGLQRLECGVAPVRKRRIEVFSEDLTALFRWRAFSLVLMRLSWDLMFATKEPQMRQGRITRCSGADGARDERG